MIHPLLSDLPAIRGTYTPNKPLAPMTTIKVGGAAEVWADFADAEDFQHFMKTKPADVPLWILGEGSNALIHDDGLKGVVCKLQYFHKDIHLEGTTLVADAGATCQQVARAARTAGLAGMAFWAGIPGSVGGALKMNAGCYGAETFDNLLWADIMVADGTLKRLHKADIPHRYRYSELPEGAFFWRGAWQLQAGDAGAIRQEMKQINAQRRESQPLELPSSGSWFKNHVADDGTVTNAWRLVDAGGCRGLKSPSGNAQVSEKHCNFFVNLGGATCAELMALSETVEARVLAETGIQLAREVRVLGSASLPNAAS